MQSVSEKWYIGYRWVSLVAAVLLLSFAGIGWVSPTLLPFGQNLQITYITGILAGIQIIYAALLYNFITKRITQWEAMLGLAMIQAAVVFGLVQTTGRMESPFMAWWAVIVLMSGIFGIYGTGGTVFVSVVYFIMATTETSGATHYTTKEIAALVVIIVAAIISQLFWRQRYTDHDNEQVASLSGQLKTNQRQSEILVESLTDGVILMSTDRQITLMNPAAATLTGWPVSEGTGADCSLVVTLKTESGEDLDQAENPILSIFSAQTAMTKILQLNSRDNRKLTVSIITSPVLDPKSHEVVGAVVVMRDISVTHQADKQRGVFISTASHEMRTPVAAIEGYLQLALNEKVSKVDPKARGYLEKALDSTHHLGQLFQDLLTSAKAEDGRLVSHPTVVELGAYVEQLADSFRFSAEKKGLLTDFIFGTNTSGAGSQSGEHVVRPLYYVHVDPDRLREVITNLFDNAVKYTPSGKVSVGLTGNADVVQLFVRDTGPGIPKEDLPHLFQKFYRVDNSATRTIGGTGLGLFICRKIIELYQGRIWVESEVDKGSTFYINLPRLSSQKAEELKSKEAQSGASEPISSLATPV